MNQDTYRMFAALERAGISYADAAELRRISMTLHRWNERECNGEVERDEETGKVFATFRSGPQEGMRHYPCRDLEKGAQKRLAAIMARYPALLAYEQGDPRGASLYIVSRADLGDRDVHSCYTRGIAVYR